MTKHLPGTVYTRRARSGVSRRMHDSRIEKLNEQSTSAGAVGGEAGVNTQHKHGPAQSCHVGDAQMAAAFSTTREYP